VNHDLNDVLVFTKVVELRSFTAAGQALGLPNSSISRKVTRLEEHLGAKLLHRTTRKLSLTDAGQLYYERSVRLVAGLEEAENMIANTQATPRGRVKMVAPPEHVFTMQLVNEFLELYPEVRVDLRFTAEPVNIIHEGYDIAILAGAVSNLSVTAAKLFDSPFQLVASPGYLKRRGTPKTVSDLADHDCVIFGRSSASDTWELRDGAETVRVPVHGRLAANHLGGISAAVLAGHGIGLLPYVGVREDIEAGAMVPVLKSCAPPSVPIYVTYESGKLLAPAVRVLLEHVKKHFASKASKWHLPKG